MGNEFVFISYSKKGKNEKKINIFVSLYTYIYKRY